MNDDGDLKVRVLRVLVDTNTRILETQKSNKNRLKNIKGLSKFGLDSLYDEVIEPLKKPLGILKMRIQTMLEFIPIYKDYLKNIDGLSMFDAAQLIVLIDDVDIKQRDKYLAYCGFSPVAVCNKGYVSKMKKGVDYSDCDIIGDEKSKTPNVSYNERLKKHIIKIVDKLIEGNGEYQDMFNTEWAKERMKDSKVSKKHVTYRAKRKLCIEFLKEYRRNKTKIMNELDN